MMSRLNNKTKKEELLSLFSVTSFSLLKHFSLLLVTWLSRTYIWWVEVWEKLTEINQIQIYLHSCILVMTVMRTNFLQKSRSWGIPGIYFYKPSKSIDQKQDEDRQYEIEIKKEKVNGNCDQHLFDIQRVISQFSLPRDWRQGKRRSSQERRKNE